VRRFANSIKKKIVVLLRDYCKISSIWLSDCWERARREEMINKLQTY